MLLLYVHNCLIIENYNLWSNFGYVEMKTKWKWILCRSDITSNVVIIMLFVKNQYIIILQRNNYLKMVIKQLYLLLEIIAWKFKIKEKKKKKN